METHIVIMAGGIGSRFWPMSTPECPKQFIDVTGCGKSLIQLTVERFQGLCIPDNIWIVTSDKYKETVRKQLPSVPPHHILTEPVARNTDPLHHIRLLENQETPPARQYRSDSCGCIGYQYG